MLRMIPFLLPAAFTVSAQAPPNTTKVWGIIIDACAAGNYASTNG
jgi:hypothetical protein